MPFPPKTWIGEYVATPTAGGIRHHCIRPTARRGPRSLAGDFLEHDVACPPVAGFEPGDIALRIALEHDLAHWQCCGEGVPTRVRQRDRSETTVPDHEFPALDT